MPVAERAARGHRTAVRFLLPAVVLAACVPAPAPVASSTPEAAVRDFSRALADGNPGAAWTLLSEATRKKADALATAGGRDGGGQEMLFSSGYPLGKLGSTRLISGSGDEAMVRVEAEGSPPQDVRLVREGGAWRLDLPL